MKFETSYKIINRIILSKAAKIKTHKTVNFHRLFPKSRNILRSMEKDGGVNQLQKVCN